MTLTDERIYIRFLELQSIISEEWGETIKLMNKYSRDSEKDNELLKEAIEELSKMHSPMFELASLMQIVVKQNKLY